MTSPAELVARARQSAGLTQRALASRAATSAAAINRYERGRVLPDLPTLARVLRACGFELRLTTTPPMDTPAWADAPAPDQGRRDRRAVEAALERAKGGGWVRPPAARPSP